MQLWRFNIPKVCLPDKLQGLFSQTLPSRFLSIGLLVGCIALPVSGFAATITGYKFTDVSGIGSFSLADGDEPRPNEFVYILNKETERFFSLRTDANGKFTLSSSEIDPTNQYSVWISLPAGWEQTTPVVANGDDGVDARIYDIDVFPASGIVQVDFGVIPLPPPPPPNPCESPDIVSTGGEWNDPSTWQDPSGNDIGRLPTDSETILIAAGTVVAPNGDSANPSIILGENGTLCIAENATLKSASNEPLFTQYIDATSSSSALYINNPMTPFGKIYNKGKIIGAEGMKGEGLLPESACSWNNDSNCGFYKRATNGSSIKIYVNILENGLTGEIRSGDGGHDRTHEYMDGPRFGVAASAPTPMPSYNFISDNGHWGILTEGGAGGRITITASETLTNEGLIKSGDGGDGDSFSPSESQPDSVHGTTVGGNGGSILVQDGTMSETPSVNSGAIVGGCGGDADIPGLFMSDSHAGNSPDWPMPTIELFIASLEDGQIQGCEGEATEVIWDPTIMKASQNTKITGYDVLIYAQENWTIDLRELSEGAVRAVESITIAVGEGGTIDLRGVSGKVFHAGTKLEIFADTILLDEGVTIHALTTAPEVIIKGAKIIRRVTLSSSSDRNLVGEPGEVLPVILDLFNAGTKIDTFDLEIIDSKGWLESDLPSSIMVDTFKHAQLQFKVRLPQERGKSNRIAVKATSQSDPSVVATETLNISVDVGPDSDGDKVADVFDAFPNDDKEWIDSDGDGIGNNADDDDDNDGMPDEWENQYDGLSPIRNDAAGDLDKDGFSNIAEFEAGTDPTDPNSKPERQPQGTAKGKIIDKQGNPIPDVEVTVDGKTTTTNQQGEWEITGLPEDQTYQVVASKPGIQFPTKSCEVGQDQDCYVEMKAGSLLSLDVKIDPRRPDQGDNITYILTLSNQGEQTATDIVLDMPLPDGTELVLVQADPSFDCQATQCTLAELAAGANATVRITIDSQAATKLASTISLQSNEYPAENVVGRVSVIPYFSIEKVSKTQTITKGDNISLVYKVAVNGNAAETAQNVQFKTELPRGYTLLGISEASCDTSNLPTLMCEMGDMGVGDSREVQLDLRLDDFYALLASHRAVVKANNYTADGAAILTKVYLGDALVDIIVAIDVTGSMHDEINALAAVIDKLKETLANSPAAQPMMAVVSFRDDIYLEVATTHLDEVEKAVGKMEAQGGGACPEASYEAMMLAVQHAKAGGTLILVTDAPPYPDVDMNALITAINDKNLELVVIQPETICAPIDGWQFQ